MSHRIINSVVGGCMFKGDHTFHSMTALDQAIQDAKVNPVSGMKEIIAQNYHATNIPSPLVVLGASGARVPHPHPQTVAEPRHATVASGENKAQVNQMPPLQPVPPTNIKGPSIPIRALTTQEAQLYRLCKGKGMLGNGSTFNNIQGGRILTCEDGSLVQHIHNTKTQQNFYILVGSMAIANGLLMGNDGLLCTL